MISLSNVTKIYGEGRATRVRALHEIDLDIGAGEFVAVVGASGSGKSTLLHILGCLDRPTEGTYVLDGKATSDLDDRELSRIRNEKIGFVFQEFHLLGDETAVGNVVLPLSYRGTPRSEARARAEAALASVGLKGRAHHRPGELSGGEQQRVAVARALAKEPTILLADEPTGNLDSKNGEQILGLLEDAHRRGITLVVITHDPRVADRAERRFTLVDGRLATD